MVDGWVIYWAIDMRTESTSFPVACSTDRRLDDSVLPLYVVLTCTVVSTAHNGWTLNFFIKKPRARDSVQRATALLLEHVGSIMCGAVDVSSSYAPGCPSSRDSGAASLPRLMCVTTAVPFSS